MMAISYFFADNTMIVLWFFLALVAVFAFVLGVRAIIKKIKSRKNQTEVDEEKAIESSEV